MPRSPVIAAFTVLVCALSCIGEALAQGPVYPAKPVTVIVGFPPGGPTDLVARLFAEHAGQSLHQAFVIENKPGANSIIATEAVASAAPDGYTLLAAAQNHAMIPALYADRIRFDPLTSFTPICMVAKSPTVLVVSSKMGVRTVPEFLAKLRDKPGNYTYASVGTGSAVHLATANLLDITKTSMIHVPYKGAAPASTALLAGEVDAYLATIGSVLPLIKTGKVTAVAVAAPTRSKLLPEVPTFAEQGVRGFEAEVWYAILGPAGMPDQAARTLEREAIAFAQDSTTAERLVAGGVEPMSRCGSAFSSALSKEIRTYTNVAKALNLKVE